MDDLEYIGLDLLEVAMIRTMIYTAAVTGCIVGTEGEAYAISEQGFDALLSLKNKLDYIELPS